MNNVGAQILSIVTESLYDDPIVVFREYVQNSIDSIFNNKDIADYSININYDDLNRMLIFCDNGNGVKQDFKFKMRKIGISDKSKIYNLGYKGIGRLSAIPYCEKIYFINILDYNKSIIEIYTLNCKKYESIKKNNDFSKLSASDIFDEIENYYEKKCDICEKAIKLNSEILHKTNSGFIVVLEGVKELLSETINKSDFINKLKWLLPLNFEDELYTSDISNIIKLLTEGDKPIIKYSPIIFNGEDLRRPISREMLRKYTFYRDFEYGFAFYSISNNKIEIDRNNPFSGIRIYMDNMLLCDENELIKNLDNFSMLNHTITQQLQTVRGIGANIYITDKFNISANARRTFFEINNTNSIEFLQCISSFLDEIYELRYALSKYVNAYKNNFDEAELNELKNKAISCIKELSTTNSPVFLYDLNDKDTELDKLKKLKKKVIKKIDRIIDAYYQSEIEISFETLEKDLLNYIKDTLEKNLK